ncbi:MAG: ABC transporter permease [Actinomycetota bacterium]
MSAPETVVRTNEPPKLRMVKRARELWRNREILANLARKELRVKYKSTALGVAWSMLNPLLYLVVFYIVFTVFLPNTIDNFPIYLLSGLLPWTLFSTGLSGSTTSIISGGNLVTKISFPRELLPLATIRAQLVNFGFQFLVLIGFLIAFGHPLIHRGVILLPLALVVLLLFVIALGFATATWNVRYRDTGHIVELVLLMWFWSTPIVYPAKTVLDRLGSLGETLYLLNPLTNIVLAFQRGIYGGTSFEGRAGLELLPAPGLRWYGFRLLAVGGASLLILAMTWRLFYRRSGDFAEEL